MEKLYSTRHLTARLFSLVVSVMAGGLVFAETITLNALESFTTVDADVALYQADLERSTLFIDTTTEVFNGQFARATTLFSGVGGIYQLTLNTLGEVAGESNYRIIINGVIAATATNDRTSDSFILQSHQFDSVFVPAGATISVESNAVSNTLVPQGSGFAFASGHWQSLTLENDAIDQAVDLQLSATIAESNLRAGDTFSLIIRADNSADTTTATSALVAIQTPSTINFNAPAECNVRAASTTMTCELAEIGPQQSVELSLPGTVNAEGQIGFEVSINSDQRDLDLSNNRSSVVLDTRDPNNPASVDLGLTVTSSTGTDILETGQQVTINAEVTNEHPTTVATAPQIDVTLPGNLVAQPGSDCSATGQLLVCALSELAPGDTDTIEFNVTALDEGNTELSLTTSAAEADNNNDNNTVVLPVSVLSIGAALTQPNQQAVNSGEGSTSGGGSISLFLLALACVLRRPRVARHLATTRMP